MFSRYIFIVLIASPFFLIAQPGKKATKLSFCGYSYTDTVKMRQHFGKQLGFLNIENNDSIVDIGAQSGTYEGILSVIGNFENVTFFLIDIDTNCLNRDKINNMVKHYEAAKGNPINNYFRLINNTPDSLWLPLRTYKKVWILNTLHEIPHKQKMIRDINNILIPGGEVIILEVMATKKHPIHGGCKMPLMSRAEIEKITTENGVLFKEEIINPVAVKKMKNPMYMIRYIKK